MKFIPFTFSAVLFLGLIACNSAAESETTTEQDSTTVAQEPEPTSTVTTEQREAVVNKGGPKAEEQLVLEEQLAKLAANKETSKDGPVSTLLGHWTGAFGKNKINITITAINESEKTAEGYSVCAGNFRPLKGTFSQEGTTYTFQLNEPGDNPYDGKFDFVIESGSQEMSGSWTPFKEKGNTAKKFELRSRVYEYDETAGDFEASSRLLTEEDVINESVEDLMLMRNEIYARHGYCFKDKDMRYHFEQQDWYMPMGVDVRHELTDIEIANITLIFEYEEYYEEYTDDFGR